MENVLDKVGALATEKLTKLNEPAVKKAEAEAKDAAEAKAKADAETQKVEGLKLAEAEAKAKKDEEILTKDEKDLSEEDKARKGELLEIKRRKEATPEAKIEKIKAESQKRIDEIKSELLETKNKSQSEISSLKAELDALKKAVQPKVDEDAANRIKREEADRISKYIEEDKSKPRNERREMSKEELQEWYLEDPDEATAWISERTLRRAEERKPKEPPVDSRKLADDFIAKQNESKAKLFAKYPGVNPSAEVLAKHRGKTNAEINAALCAESEEFRICSEIVASDPKKYLESPNGPELVMAEMGRRLAEKKPKTVTLTEEELEAKIQAEAERRALVDAEGITSTKGKPRMEKESQNDELRQYQEKMAAKVGISKEDLAKVIERQKGMKGRNFGPKDE